MNLLVQNMSEHPTKSDSFVGTAFWFAAYTSARHEKRVAEHLRQREVESFLPLYEALHRWKNGRHRVQLPLFPGYVFVHLPLREKLRVLQVPGIVELVSFNGVPAALPDAEIETLRNALSAGLPAEPYPFLRVGSRVEICRGPLQGLSGILLRRQGQLRVVLSVEMIMRSIVVEVEASDVVVLDRKTLTLAPVAAREAERIASA